MIQIKADLKEGKCTSINIERDGVAITNTKLVTFLEDKLEESVKKMLELENNDVVEWDVVENLHFLKIHIPDLNLDEPHKHPFFQKHLKNIEYSRKQQNIKNNRNSIERHITETFIKDYEWSPAERSEFNVEFEKELEKVPQDNIKNFGEEYFRKKYKEIFLMNKHKPYLEVVFEELKQNPNINVLSWFYNNDYDDPHNNLDNEFTCSRIKNEPFIYNKNPDYISNKYVSKNLFRMCLNGNREFKYFGCEDPDEPDEKKEPIVLERGENTLVYKDGVLINTPNISGVVDVVVQFKYIGQGGFEYDVTEHSYWDLLEINL